MKRDIKNSCQRVATLSMDRELLMNRTLLMDREQGRKSSEDAVACEIFVMNTVGPNLLLSGHKSIGLLIKVIQRHLCENLKVLPTN